MTLHFSPNNLYNPSPLTLSPQLERVAKFFECFVFLLTGNTRDDVAREAADEGRRFKRKLQGVDQRPRDRRKGIAVVIRKGSQTVALAAHFDHLMQSHHALMR